MAYCKKFVSGIASINFVSEHAGLIKHILLSSVYQSLKTEHETIRLQLDALPVLRNDNAFAEEQLSQYKTKQQAILTAIHARMESIRQADPAVEEPVSIGNPAWFIQDLAGHFRNIKHLADTLSDAPEAIKHFQIDLIVEMLSKLPKDEQEKQWQTLSIANIQDVIRQALLMYDHPDSSEDLRHQSQRLAQMAMHEIVRRASQRISQDDSLTAASYQEWLSELRSQLPNVGASAILDTLSQHQDSQGRSIADLVMQVELQSGLDMDGLKARKALFDALRFGQDDRREYAKKTIANLIRDLFWARNIHEIELFRKDGLADAVFTSLAEQRVLGRRYPSIKRKSPYVNLIAPKDVVISEENKMSFNKLEDILDEAWPNKPKGILPSNFDSHQREIKAFISSALEKFNQPKVELSANGEIAVTFHCCEQSSALIDSLYSVIKVRGGLGNNVNTLMQGFFDDSEIRKRLHGVKLSGYSLAEISGKLNALSEPAHVAVYRAQLDQIKQNVGSENCQLSALDLGDSELLLRQLLELYALPENIRPKARAMHQAFEHIKIGDYKKALQIQGLPPAVEAAYRKLSEQTLDTLPPPVRPIVEKAKSMISSATERHAKSEALKSAFRSGVDVAETVETLFKDEYQSMSPVLGLTPADVSRMNQDIHTMATEMVRLVERTSRGEPTLTSTEMEAYVFILKQIADQIKPKSLDDVQFKVKHASTGQITLTVYHMDGNQKVTIDLGQEKLPYSLLKPLHGECVISFGGSRGVIAPFEGLDEAYAGKEKKKGKLFTHSKLLGVGQYGSVKEVEQLFTGLNQVSKQGYVPSDEPTFSDRSRTELRTRPLTSRDDPLYRIECDVLKHLSLSERERGGQLSTTYWIEDDKQRQRGRLFSKDKTPKKYHILTTRAKGDTLADTSNAELNLYPKGAIEYHDPTARGEKGALEQLDALKEALALSNAVVTEAERFSAQGFSHNDIKPENFLYKKNVDGSYPVRFIDWATGGFQSVYQGNKTTAEDVFHDVFGQDLPFRPQGRGHVVDLNGRFVREEDARYVFGVNPQLEILHGARNGTLPYISPKVLGASRDKVPLPADAPPSPSMNTEFETPNDSFMDDWALTAMTFGVCNRQAYFRLVKGRAVGDYVIPGVLDVDDKRPQGLKITDSTKFNAYFACDEADQISPDDLKGQAYEEKNAVMFIPSNQREGAPLHLYRRLRAMQRHLFSHEPNEVEQKIIRDIDTILHRVHDAVLLGEGLTKQALQETLLEAQRCIRDYEALNDAEHQHAIAKQDIIDDVFPAVQEMADLFKLTKEKRHLDVVLTYPKRPEDVQKAITILDTCFTNEERMTDTLFVQDAPGRHLLKQCMQEGQHAIVKSLLEKITTSNRALIELVQQDALLHYACELGMTDVFNALIAALKRAGASDKAIFEWMMQQYGPGEGNKDTAPHIKWATNCLHIAVRNNNEEQLKAILACLNPEESIPEDRLFALVAPILHLSARLGNKALFEIMVDKYNALHPNKMDAKAIFGMTFPPDESSPYHLFMRDERTGDLKWAYESENKDLAKTFLLTAPAGTFSFPALIAAKHSHFSGVEQVIALGETLGLSVDEWYSLFTETDEEGKNLLNLALEQGKRSFIGTLLSSLTAHCGERAQETLVHLLSNPHPVNPLKNYLMSEPNETLQFEVLHQLLDALCSDFTQASPSKVKIAQQARMVALLVNEAWLIKKAQNKGSHEALRHLFINDALSNAFKQGLLAQLTKDTDANSVEQTFFRELLDLVSPQKSSAHPSREQLALFSEGKREAIRQNADLEALLKALVDDRQQTVNALEEKIEALSSQLSLEKQGLVDSEGVLATTKAQLLASEQSIQALNAQVSALMTQHADDLTAHDALRQLRAELIEAESNRNSIQKSLDEQANALQERTENLSLMTSKMEQLSGLNQRLQFELGEEKEEKIHLAEELTRTKIVLEEQQTAQTKMQNQWTKTLDLSMKDFTRLNKEIETLTQSNRAMERNIDGLRDKALEVDLLSMDLKAKVDELEALRSEHRALKTSYSSLEETNRGLSNAVDDLKRIVMREERSKVNHLFTSEQSIRESEELRELEARRDLAKSLEDTIQREQTRQLNDKQKQEERQNEKTRLAMSIGSLSASIDTMRSQSEKYKEALEQQQKESEKLAQLLEEERVNHAKEVVELKDNIESLGHDNSQAKLAAEKALEEAKARHEKEIDRLKKQLNDADVSRKELVSQMESTNAFIDRCRVEEQRLRDDIKTLNSKNKGLDEANSVLHRQLIEAELLSIKLEYAQRDNEELQQQKNALKEEKDALDASSQALKETMEALRSQCDEKEEEIMSHKTWLEIERQEREAVSRAFEAYRTTQKQEAEVQRQRVKEESEKQKQQDKMALSEQLAQVKKLLQDVDSNSEKAQENLEAMEQQLADSKRTVANLQELLAQKESELLELTHTKEEAEQRNQEERARLENQLDAQCVQNDKLQQVIQEKNLEHEGIAAKAHALEFSTEELRAANQTLSDEKGRLQERFDALLQERDEIASNAALEAASLTQALAEKDTILGEQKRALEYERREGAKLTEEIRQNQAQHALAVNNLRDDIQLNQTQLQEVEGKLKISAQRVEILEQALVQKDDVLKEKQSEIKEKEKENSAIQDTVHSLEEEILKTQEAKKTLSEQLARVELQYKASDEKLEQVETEKRAIEAKADSERALFEAIQTDFEKEKATLNAAHQSTVEGFKKEIAEVSNRHRALLEDKEKSEQQARESLENSELAHKKEVERLTAEKDALTQRLGEAQKQIDEGGTRLEGSERAREALEQSNRELKEQLDKAIIDAQQKDDALAREKVLHEAAQKDLTRQLDEEKTRVVEAHTVLAQTQQELGQLKSDSAEQIKALERRLAEKDEANRHQEQRIHDKDDEIARLQKECDALKVRPAPPAEVSAESYAKQELVRQINHSRNRVLLTAIAHIGPDDDVDNRDWHPLDSLNIKHLNVLRCEARDGAYKEHKKALKRAAIHRLRILNRACEAKKNTYLDGDYEAALEQDAPVLESIDDRLRAMETMDSRMRAKLTELSHMTALNWFSPLLRGKAKKNALLMSDHFSELATTCKSLMEYLVSIRNELNEQIQSFPSDDEMDGAPGQEAINQRRAEFVSYLNRVNQQIELYKHIYTHLYGNPRKPNSLEEDGVIETIRKIKDDAGGTLFGRFNFDVEEHPMSRRAEFFNSGYLSGHRDTSGGTHLSAGDNRPRFSPLDSFKANSFRAHTYVDDDGKVAGGYIEERAQSYQRIVPRDKTEYVPDLKLTVNHFPSDPNAVIDRIHFSLGVAANLVGALGAPPTADKPILLRGRNEVELRFLWTALMILGEELPSMKFDHKAIHVLSPTFNPEKEVGALFFRYSKSSCYETTFKPHRAYVDGLIGAMKLVCKDDASSQKKLDKAHRLTKAISSGASHQLKKTVAELREQPTPRVKI